MQFSFKRFGLAAALAVGALAAATTAQARDRYRDDDGSDVALAIGAGIIGLAIGAAIADRDDRHYYDRGYYGHRRYVRVRDYPGYYYYYDGYPNRYYRDRYYDRYSGRYQRNRWRDGYYNNRWNRGYDRVDRWYGRNSRGYRDRDYRGRDYRHRDYRDRGYRDRRWRN
ncbi:MAG: hypothetical protein R3E09_11470 [Novosphingobium sp.]